uniref:OAR domain-containing protein n=1 Tax=Syphacia muris TaxID=451379 RepID=A0A0N5AXA4_9BILA
MKGLPERKSYSCIEAPCLTQLYPDLNESRTAATVAALFQHSNSSSHHHRHQPSTSSAIDHRHHISNPSLSSSSPLVMAPTSAAAAAVSVASLSNYSYINSCSHSFNAYQQPLKYYVESLERNLFIASGVSRVARNRCTKQQRNFGSVIKQKR